MNLHASPVITHGKNVVLHLCGKSGRTSENTKLQYKHKCQVQRQPHTHTRMQIPTLLRIQTWSFRAAKHSGAGQKGHFLSVVAVKKCSWTKTNFGGHICLRRGREFSPVGRTCLPVGSGRFRLAPKLNKKSRKQRLCAVAPKDISCIGAISIELWPTYWGCRP